ncbi:oligopeptide transporter, OPT family [Brachybacterium huguangmaarense]|uniref:Oligopeptide transporter, OPT family n=1 Tax=Brachybacterium huguangmaarense TaxID=1652028 RepID=A0ABY6G2H9_9MICO|nr:oligopeptide transporter, OPT family [Brachybacterium huguangmaarense]UYG17184.1 oligopeptide transporter, OPT family [Brachybacterium huguangmaarense]
MSASSTPSPTASAPARRSAVKELTIRGIVIGGIITLVFTAANVYLGLKVGLTFATSIPAAVISMAILRFFKDHSIVENNIVQTIASAAGTLSAIIFVLPGLVIVGWWSGFPYWTTAALCALGGILGVMYSIPLRRTLVTGSDLPYPEGVAAAEVLKVGDSHGAAEENRRGLHVILAGGLASAGMSLLSALRLTSSEISTAFRVGEGGTMFGASLSLALIGVGHLVGITVGIAMIVGMLVSYGVLLPIFSSGQLPASGDIADTVGGIFSSDVRFIGAGAIAIAAVWTLVKLIVPIVRGIMESLAASRTRRAGGQVDVTERDIPVGVVALVTVLSMVPIGFLLWDFIQGTPIAHNTFALIAISVVFILVLGLVIAAVCGYMAGLIGASNSPISGVGIVVAITAALLIRAVHGGDAHETAALVAFTLFVSAVVFGIATISNDNLQDLKTGQLVGATPWKQQVSLVIGVVFGSIVIPPVLQLMYTAFGFSGDPNAGPNALAAPQASLFSSLVKGVMGGDLQWNLIGIGALVGIGAIIVDEVLTRTTKSRKHRLALPPLAVGMGMYLPMSLTLIIPVGALLGMVYDRWANRTKNPERSKRLGVLMATGLIVGESLFGVLNAGIIAGTGKETPLAVVGDGFATAAQVLGALVFIAIVAALYRWVRAQARTTEVTVEQSRGR